MSVQNPPHPLPHTSIIAAVGRSGTTVIHRLLLEIYADVFGRDFDVLYEPFVWDSETVGLYPMDKSREALFQGRDAISEEGIFLHTQIPLFSGGEGLSPEVRSLTASYLKGNGTRPLLGKFIRANGRLSLLDSLYPDGRFLVVLRNPLDVVNSVLPMFSFYGAEFHRNDYPRFAVEVRERFGVTLPAERELPPAYKAALWCHFMNLAAVKHAAGKAHYRVVIYEDFSSHRDAYARLICEHIGAPYKDAYGAATAAPVGRIAKGPPVLGAGDVALLMPIFEQYLAMVEPLAKRAPIDKDRILRKYANLPPQGNYDARGLGWSPVRLERELFTQRRAAQNIAAAHRGRVADVQRHTLAREAGPDSLAVNANAGVSVVVTSFNTADTVGRAVDSVLGQSFPVSEIIIADDASRDHSRAVLEAIAAKDRRIRLILRDQTIGLSANRNDGIRHAKNTFFCHLDAGETFHADKIAREVRALQHRTDSVAFSDAMRLETEDYDDASWLAGLSGSNAVAGVLSRRAPPPRNMLMSVDLFLGAGGYGQDDHLHDDWAFQIRLANKARHWLYSGGPGTLGRSSGAPRADTFGRVYRGLSALCNETADVIAQNRGYVAALVGLLTLMHVDADVDFNPDGPLEEALGSKLAAVFDEIRTSLLDKPASAYVGNEAAFFDRLRRLLATVGVTVP